MPEYWSLAMLETKERQGCKGRLNGSAKEKDTKTSRINLIPATPAGAHKRGIMSAHITMNGSTVHVHIRPNRLNNKTIFVERGYRNGSNRANKDRQGDNVRNQLSSNANNQSNNQGS